MKRAIWVVALVVILSGASYASWKFWDNKNAKTKSTEQTKPGSSGSIKYLVIQEWGVKLPLTKNILNAEYIKSDEQTMHLTTKEIKLVPGCEDRQVMGLQRAKIGQYLGPSIVDESYKNSSVIKNIGEYYYLFIAAPFSCNKVRDKNSPDFKLLDETRTEFENAVLKIEGI